MTFRLSIWMDDQSSVPDRGETFLLVIVHGSGVTKTSYRGFFPRGEGNGA
jgi:hypothetical protein